MFFTKIKQAVAFYVNKVGIVDACTCSKYNNDKILSLITTIDSAGLSYLGIEALTDLAQAMQSIEQQGICGDVVETGCALGGSSIILVATKGARNMFVYDVFGMIPPPSVVDGPDVHERYNVIRSGASEGLKGSLYYGYEENLLEKVMNNFAQFGYPPDQHQVHFVQGLYEDTLHCKHSVALAHIDCDWYESVKVCLERIGPHMVKQGRIVIDDYYAYSGCQKAVDEFVSTNPQFSIDKKSRLHLVRTE